MTAPGASALGGRRDRLWPAALGSAAAHAALLAAAALARPAPIIDLEQKPIVARLVRLGQPRPAEWLPRKEAPPRAAAPPALPTPGATATSPPRAPGPERPDRLSSVLDRLRREQALGSPGSPGGSPLGQSSEEEGDRYLALVQQALHASYVLEGISQADCLHLEARVGLTVEPDGRVSGSRFERKSGHEAFDAALSRAVRRARLPPPPAELRERYRREGLGVRFHCRP